MRGADMTRTDTFTDAAFAFAVSLLVLSTDSLPTRFDQLTDALLGVPVFAPAFALIMTFRRGHWTWSRRFGIEDGHSIALSCIGYVAMALVIVGLNAHALGLRSPLDLDTVELCSTRAQIRAWAIPAGVGALSAALAVVLTVSCLMLPGWVFMPVAGRDPAGLAG